MKTETKTTANPTPEQAASKGEIAVIGASRLPYHPLIEERFGFDRADWRALTDAIFPSAKTVDAVVLALSYCKARKLDPFKRVVHIVPVWSAEKGAYVETVWPGIAEHRTTAFRTKQWAGSDEAKYGPEVERAFTGQVKEKGAWVDLTITLKFPTWCQLTVYRMIEGQRVQVPGPRVYFVETYSRRGRSDLPNERWQRAPYQMIEKCAEAAALRRAFPEELGEDHTAEEADSAELKDVTPPKRPERSDYIAEQVAGPEAAAEAGPDFDPETGEVLSDEQAAHMAEIAAGVNEAKLAAGLSQAQDAPAPNSAENSADQTKNGGNPPNSLGAESAENSLELSPADAFYERALQEIGKQTSVGALMLWAKQNKGHMEALDHEAQHLLREVYGAHMAKLKGAPQKSAEPAPERANDE